MALIHAPSPPPKVGHELLTVMVDRIVADLEKFAYDPNETIIIHPPSETSYAEDIATAVERETGALYRRVLHREIFAGYRRFSGFVEHGVSLKARTVILIDDGANTGETLLGLLDAAAVGQPARILAYVALTRMPLYKLDVLRRIDTFGPANTKVHFDFGVTLSIPVYTPRTCPICKLRSSLSDMEHRGTLLRRYARAILAETELTNTGRHAAETSRQLLWRFAPRTSVARLREAIELADYDDDANGRILCALDHATNPSSGDASECLLNLAFIICTEPKLLRAPLFVPYLGQLLSAVAKRLGVCQEDEILTLGAYGFHLMVRAGQKGIRDCNIAGKALWHGLLGRSTLSIQTIGRILTSILGEAHGEQLLEQETCLTWTNELLGALRTHAPDGGDLTSAFGRLLAREAINDLHGGLGGYTATVDASCADTLYELASSAGSKFWWHASDMCRVSLTASSTSGMCQQL